MGLINNIMFCRNLWRNVLFSLKTKGHNRINCKACSFHHISLRSEVKKNMPCSRSHAVTTSVPHLHLIYAENHTTKGWKVRVKKEFIEQEEPVSDDHEACEDGTEAVPHSTLMSHLQNCSSVQEQIDQLCLTVSLTKEDLENRRAFAQSLFDLLVPYFPKMRINLFGSSINGFGFKGCDCDVSIDVNGQDFDDEAEGEEKKGSQRVQLPTVDDVESGKVPVDHVSCLPPRYLLRFVRRVFRKYGQGMSHICLIKARHPILRFYDKKHNLFCDFSCGNKSSLQNTRVIRFVGNLDDRVMPLIKILRYWGKHRRFIGDIEQFNSYAFSLIVVYFLQNTNPPVLPTVAELLEKSDYVQASRVGDDEALLNDLKKFTPSRNTQTVEELLKEFFFYYMYFDFSQVLCPLNSLCVPKMEFKPGPEPFQVSTISLQDPFQLSFNLSHAATESYCKLFLKSVLEACQSYQKTEIWVPSQSSSWGISSLFGLPIQEEPTPENTDLVHTIEIPLEAASLSKLLKSGLDIDSAKEMWFQKASKAVVDMFEYGLLFECRTLKSGGVPPPEQTDPKSLVKILCDAHHNVFSGRSNFRGISVPCDTVNNVLLEKEHAISVKLSQMKNEDGKRVLFRFQCECLELQKDVPTLLVSLKFGSYKPPVLVFLREYLPKFVQHSLLID